MLHSLKIGILAAVAGAAGLGVDSSPGQAQQVVVIVGGGYGGYGGYGYRHRGYAYHDDYYYAPRRVYAPYYGRSYSSYGYRGRSARGGLGVALRSGR